ncbi:MAG: type III secretion system outer membrane ring subunit SctC [Burkholderiales bacterium]|nr:type III secretion system outer membrane ring subunit SctC [Burkholderiales bacterium]MDE2608893.1 type III secretion system outer membrane ring subunit SctC [Burkholderiales bacterium]TAL54275.1 MAG: EscC/YscC/HrcC family type III secretion system outer membrane ring protein [Pandoraea sp.]TAM17171.1 MAG: EscC/YscC/HrcC family type III secretion system outer membrane ring protein [Pandoraea sp.]
MMNNDNGLQRDGGGRMTKLWWARLMGVAVALNVLLIAHAIGAELHWKNRPFSIVADNKNVGDFIRELASSQGVTAVINPKVGGVISGKFDGAPAATLNTVCATYGLTWYYDGSFLYVDPASQARTEVFSIPKGSAQELSRVIEAMRIPDRRFPLVISDKENTVYVSGPNRYVDLVKQALNTFSNPSYNDDRAEIRAFPLKYMWASDFTINRDGKEVTVPGMATLLRRLFGLRKAGSNDNAPPALEGGATRQLKLAGGSTFNVPNIQLPTMQGNAGAAYGGNGSGLPQFGGTPDLFGMGSSSNNQLPKIEADPAINAVLIRDLPERMGQYRTLIDSLDSRPQLLEIDLTIMDIDTSSLQDLGIDWRVHTKHGDFQFGHGTNPALTFNAGTTEAGQTLTDSNGNSITPTGMALTASIGGSVANYLVARVNALAQTGDARLRATPRVLTLNNTEAMLQDLQTFYVPVSGYQDSSLYGVTVGTSVKVTPLIVKRGSGQMDVKLSIQIDDGNQTGTTTSDNIDIPVVEQRSIVTQTMLQEGKSLLIAGFNTDQFQNNKTGIPLLQDIPILGHLFKYTNKSGKHMERFYLLTPRVVVADSTLPPSAIDNGAVPPNAQPVYRGQDAAAAAPQAQQSGSEPSAPTPPKAPGTVQQAAVLPSRQVVGAASSKPYGSNDNRP